jgi:galactose mutarotase-like enzyme
VHKLTLADPATSSHVELVPERGGLVTRFTIAGRPILYMDDATLADPKRNVRGGVPVLFPSPGKLANDRWSRDGRAGALPQHGFARNLPWTVVAADEAIVLELESPHETWPFPCRLRHHITLAGTTLRIEQRVTNTGTHPLPFGLGFHPYFQVANADKARVTVDTTATRAWDNTRKRAIDLGTIQLATGEVDLHLLDHGRSDCSLLLDAERLVRIDCSPEYGQWVIWTLPERDFVCLEPWTCPFDALNTGERLLELAPGESRDFFVAMSG